MQHSRALALVPVARAVSSVATDPVHGIGDIADLSLLVTRPAGMQLARSPHWRWTKLGICLAVGPVQEILHQTSRSARPDAKMSRCGRQCGSTLL